MAEDSGHILVVDDSRMNRIKLAHSLEQQGHAVSLAESGPQALDMLAGQSFDVVLLDVMMPEMDGYEVLERMKADARLRDVPVIIISALDELDSVARGIELGAEDYLPRAYNPVLLKARLHASLSKKRLRDLERAYLEQEVMLRQAEKLATLGKLSAGMAHELNNPAAAARRSADQLRGAVAQLQAAHLRLGRLQMDASQLDALLACDQLLARIANNPPLLDALDRSDREAAVEAWLEKRGVDGAWEYAPVLVDLGYQEQDLMHLAQTFTPEQIPIVLQWLSNTYGIYSLLRQVAIGTDRISQLVKALKSYTYMDQAPQQAVDVREGLEDTLVMLAGKLRTGVTVHREYHEPLPKIQAYGSELNQVWTNIIDNAIDAMHGQGDLILRARQEGDWVIVEIEDHGPGIPQEIQPRVFDPFFTTKPVGQGTGLGLNIVYNIVTQKHKGTISLDSGPGRTCFEVRLPLT